MKILVVGAGLYGAVMAHEAAKKGNKVLVIDQRDHLAGNIYTKEIKGIQVHRYGAHIFHTSDRRVWEFIQQFAEFNRYTNSPIANYHGKIYNLPFNMNTFNVLWGVTTPSEAQAAIAKQRAVLGGKTPANLEEQAISLVGTDIYQKLIKEYTEKQWGRPCNALPAFIIRRLPVRYTYDNNYFNDRYQGIPRGGYTPIVEKMLADPLIKIELNTDFFAKRREYLQQFDRIIYTGMIDQYFDYRYGALEYRSLRFETEIKDCPNAQGNAVVNYTDKEHAYTRIIEHKHFEFGTQPQTVLTKEYPAAWEPGAAPYYPVNDERNTALFQKYAALAAAQTKTLFGGRLGMYRYYNMDQVIASALAATEQMMN